MSIGGRLREERDRLEMSQDVFSAVGGVLKRAQINYEKGERVPDGNYFAAIAVAGADVLYILTGQRSGAATRTVDLDTSLLAQVIAGVDQLLEKSGKVLPASKKAPLIVTLYRTFSTGHEIDPGTIGKLISRAA